tara:strand:+ start:5277 stop:6509 length:1233 start_codon:yes stop_codon:yes gene_type:complete
MIKKSIKIKKCRACNSTKLVKSFSLGNIAHAGKFPKNKKVNIPKDYINILFCNNCYLVQLDRNYDLKYMFNSNYGYRSGINNTMSTHLKNLASTISKNFNLKKNDKVLDIASNDGTLLNHYNNDIIKVGIDPIANKFNRFYKNIDHKIPDFFNSSILKKKKLFNFKIITALAVLYDLPDPNKFIIDMKEVLDEKGIIIIEVADLYQTLKKNIFDTFCHEHLEYYSYYTLNVLMKKHKLKIFDHKFFDINGGSSRYYICREENKRKINKRVKIISNLEKKEKIFTNLPLKIFSKKINILKTDFLDLLKDIKTKNKIIHGYGASTKGNILIQYYGLNDSQIDFIAEKNKEKFNSYTPGSKIKIISEIKSRKMKPDFYVVFPWHFKKEILIRENKIRKNGTKFIFPLPSIKIA